MLIDLTMEIKTGLVFREGTPPVKISENEYTSNSEGRFKTVFIETPSHMGTHIDIMDPKNIISPDRFITDACMIDITGNPPDHNLCIEDIREDINIIKEGDFVIFKTGWEKYLETETYNRHVEFDQDILNMLINKKVNMVAIDAPGIARGKNHSKCDKALADKDIFVVENLINVDFLKKDIFTIYCFPLKMKDTDALFARIVADL